MFSLIVLLSGIRDVIDFCKSKNIDSGVLFDTLFDVKIWVESYYDRKGVWELDQLGPLTGHFHGKIF